MTVDILIPVLGRPDRAAKVAESAYDAATVITAITFLCSPGDEAQIAACMAVPVADTIVVTWEPEGGDYAKKINYGAKVTGAEHVFTGADDLVFEYGWDQGCLNRIGPLGVCGTNDLGNALVRSGRHSTHSLVSMEYINAVGATYLDGPGVLLHEGYDHQWIDNELVHAAQQRRQWAFSPSPAVEHLHPFWPDEHGHPKARMDPTYEKAMRGGRSDQRLYLKRRREFMVGRASSRIATQRIVHPS